ncbi:hypothetical protein LZ30DRAFT_420401 [Colletotrichum cereale]|nr:hypothetical protein LZ30DRAFT_420401 [Colletotrichum cereale]
MTGFSETGSPVAMRPPAALGPGLLVIRTGGLLPRCIAANPLSTSHTTPPYCQLPRHRQSLKSLLHELHRNPAPPPLPALQGTCWPRAGSDDGATTTCPKVVFSPYSPSANGKGTRTNCHGQPCLQSRTVACHPGTKQSTTLRLPCLEAAGGGE